MAEKRMFSKEIIDSDAFLTMPVSSQNLYFHLGMRADDDGFVNKVQSIMSMCKASADDLRVLVSKKYIIPFESGIIVIKHWRINNYIQKDRYKSTNYIDLLHLLEINENKSYSLKNADNSECIQNVYKVDTQIRLDKIRLDKIREESAPARENVAVAPSRSQFVKPSLDEIKAYCNERGNYISAEAFFNHYESNGWKVGKTAMKDWKAAVRGWEIRHKAENPEFYINEAKATTEQERAAEEEKRWQMQEQFKKDKQWLELDKKRRALTLAIVNGEDRQAELESVKKAMAELEAVLCN